MSANQITPANQLLWKRRYAEFFEVLRIESGNLEISKKLKWIVSTAVRIFISHGDSPRLVELATISENTPAYKSALKTAIRAHNKAEDATKYYNIEFRKNQRPWLIILDRRSDFAQAYCGQSSKSPQIRNLVNYWRNANPEQLPALAQGLTAVFKTLAKKAPLPFRPMAKKGISQLKTALAQYGQPSQKGPS